MPELRGADPRSGALLLVAIGAMRSTHQRGAAWREAARLAGWSWQTAEELADRMHALRRAGLLTFTREPRSLDVTPAGRRWALSILANERAARTRTQGARVRG
jgi:hypothetical protein